MPLPHVSLPGAPARQSDPSISDIPRVEPPTRTAVFFVASPLHYLAAVKVAKDFESASRKVLILYSAHVQSMVDPSFWDAHAYTPWPRLAPLPGFAGGHRRLLGNVALVAGLVGRCDTLVVHGPVYDTEAVNYHLHSLRKHSQAGRMLVRIIPDGLLNVQRYPLAPIKRFAQHLRRLRSLVSPGLRYTTFSGDRIGSDAPFVDRIYVLSGIPHQYDERRCVALGPLVDAMPAAIGADQSAPIELETTRAVGGAPNATKTALVVGQPLVGFARMHEAHRAQVSRAIAQWLGDNGVTKVWYKAHPKEAAFNELREPHYQLLEITEALETHMAKTPYDIIVGCCSTALFTGRQIYGPDKLIAAFGMDAVMFKGFGNRDNFYAVMKSLNIPIYPVLAQQVD